MLAPIHTPNPQAMQEHLEFLFSRLSDYDDGRIEISLINKPNIQAEKFQRSEISKAVRKAVEWNSVEGNSVYVIASLLDPNCAPFGRSGDEDFYATSVLWVDIDDEIEPDVLKERYAHCPPSYVVITGRKPYIRTHFYWELFESATDAQEVRKALTGLQQNLGGDPSVKNPVRLMRLGGSIAWPKKEGRVAEVTEVKRLGNPPVAIEAILQSYPVQEKKPNTSIKQVGAINLEQALKDTQISGQWHTHMLKAVASMVFQNMTDDEIIAKALPYRVEGYSEEGTIEEITEFINSARTKYDKPEPQRYTFDELRQRALELSSDTHPDTVEQLLRDLSDLGTIHRREVQEIIKDRKKIPFSTQDRYFKENNINTEADHLVIARAVIQDIGRDNILCSDPHVWFWDDSGVWKSLPERALKNKVQGAIELQGERVTDGLVRGVTEVLKAEIYQSEHQWNIDQAAVNFTNGELHWSGSKWLLELHNREHYRTTQIPHSYDPDADCPRFKQFLGEVFEGDTDGQDKAQCILEMMGYSLMCTAHFEKFIMLVGSGSNGKSVILGVLEAVLGNQNVCAVQPSRFSSTFQRAYLHMKLANLVTEIAEGAQVADAELKAIVSGENTTVENKNQDPFSFRPYSTCWFGTNHMPHTRDYSDALFRRALVVPFNNKFEEGVNADPDLKVKLKKEIPAILNLSLEAYAGVLQSDSFTEPESCKEAKKAWRFEADQVAQFAQDKCELGGDFWIESGLIYQEYVNWCIEAGITRRLNRNNFSSRMVKLGARLTKGTSGQRNISGVKLKR